MTNNTTKIHKAVGIIGFLTFIVMNAIAMTPDLTVPRHFNVLLVITFLTCLGFGHIMERVATVAYGGTPPPAPAPQGTNTDTDTEGTDK